MNQTKILEKLEQDLSHFLVNENCRYNPSLRGSPELYRYRGLTITANDQNQNNEKTVFVRIGPLEAEYRVDSGDKTSGGLAPEDERLIEMWLRRDENSETLRNAFYKNNQKLKIAIVPFDLEEFYS